MQTGYELFGRIVRPAMVAVTPKAAAAAEPAQNPYGKADDPGISVDTKA
jgi:molecular chaperone GrpE